MHSEKSPNPKESWAFIEYVQQITYQKNIEKKIRETLFTFKLRKCNLLL